MFICPSEGGLVKAGGHLAFINDLDTSSSTNDRQSSQKAEYLCQAIPVQSRIWHKAILM